MRPTVRLCWLVNEKNWILSAMAITAGLAFVAGCLLFYAQALFEEGVTLFLVGSVLVLLNAVGEAILRHGPSE